MKKNLADALIDFLEATKTAILGFGASNSKDNYKSASYFLDGSKFARSASDILQTISHFDQAFSQIAKSAYEYSILLKELERQARDSKKLQQLPLDQLFSILKQLTFLS